MKRSQPGGAQGRVYRSGGTDCAELQTQEDQVHEELNADQCGWRVGREPGGGEQGLDHTRKTSWDVMRRCGWVFNRVD